VSAAAETTSVSRGFDVFAHRPIQTSVLGTMEAAYKPIAAVEQNHLEFFIPADNDTYVDLDIKLYVRGKLKLSSGKCVNFSDHTGVTNNFLHSLYSQCNVTLIGFTITQTSEHYHYRTYRENLMTYGTDVAANRLPTAYWYLDTGDMLLTDPSAKNLTATANLGFITCWHRLRACR